MSTQVDEPLDEPNRRKITALHADQPTALADYQDFIAEFARLVSEHGDLADREKVINIPTELMRLHLTQTQTVNLNQTKG